jgi:hypothetical protein
VIQPDREADAAAEFLAWLNDGTPPPLMADPEEATALVDRIKTLAHESVKADMTQWWRERGFKAAHMTQADLDEARVRLADLLIDVSTNGDESAGGASSGEPDDSDGDSRGAGDNHTAPAPEPDSTVVAVSPDADGGEAGQDVQPVSPSDATPDVEKDACVRCGSTRTKRIIVGGQVVCEIISACRARAELASSAA